MYKPLMNHTKKEIEEFYISMVDYYKQSTIKFNFIARTVLASKDPLFAALLVSYIRQTNTLRHGKCMLCYCRRKMFGHLNCSDCVAFTWCNHWVNRLVHQEICCKIEAYKLVVAQCKKRCNDASFILRWG